MIWLRSIRTVAILTEPEVVFNDEIAGFIIGNRAFKLLPGRQSTYRARHRPASDPYTLRRDVGPIDSFRNARYFALTFGYPNAGTGDCFVRPFPAAPAPPWKPFPAEPGYAFVPTIKPATINFN
jgi:hypothetical protein